MVATALNPHGGSSQLGWRTEAGLHRDTPGNHAAIIMSTTAMALRSASRPRPRRARRISHRVRPADMDVVAWQRALRIQAGEEASFRMRNLGGHAIFSEFAVGNPAKGSIYRVAIRGEALSVNYCACADFATNRLGVCKHIAFVLHCLRRRPGAARQLQAGHTPPFSEIAVAYDGRPRLRLLVGGDCPPPLQRLAAKALSAHGDIDAAAIPRLLRVADRLGHEIRIYDDARDLMAAAADDSRRRQLLAAAYPKGAKDPKLARLLRGITLHPYMRDIGFEKNQASPQCRALATPITGGPPLEHCCHETGSELPMHEFGSCVAFRHAGLRPCRPSS
jgi:hypothetical protein